MFKIHSTQLQGELNSTQIEIDNTQIKLTTGLANAHVADEGVHVAADPLQLCGTLIRQSLQLFLVGD